MITSKNSDFDRVLLNNGAKVVTIHTSCFKASFVIKKFLSAILCAAMLFTMAACTPSISPDDTTPPEPTEKAEQTPTVKLPEYEKETVLLNDIGSYTIVYPSEYTDYRKQDVELLQKVIKNVTGASLKIISDLDEASGKEIIIASSKRKNGVEDAIEKFQSGLDYVVAVRNGNIVLGGNNFYADMRAIYDFINNTLGYDDIENKQGEAKTELSGVNYHIYDEPSIRITGSNFSVPAYTEQKAIRDMASAHFNMTLLEPSSYSQDQMFDMLKWCARYEIFVMLLHRGPDYSEICKDCPAVWTTLVVDEPGTDSWSEMMDTFITYNEQYGKYGWKPFLNFIPVVEMADTVNWWRGLLDDLPMVSFDVYPGHSLYDTYRWDMDLLGCYERYSYLAREYNKDLWVYIDSYEINSRKQNTGKMFRRQGYIALSFGAKNISYFQYGDTSVLLGDGVTCFPNDTLINGDFSKNPAWFDAQRFNEEILRIAPIYSKYEAVGACTLNAPPDEPLFNYGSPYPYAKDIVSEYICEDKLNEDAYLLGFFDNKYDDKAHAFTIVNISDINDESYESDKAMYVKFKINGENVTFYRNGLPENVEKTEDGYYRVNMANGYCWFVTVD